MSIELYYPFKYSSPIYDWWLGTNSALSHLHITSDMMLSSASDPLLKLPVPLVKMSLASLE